jgi:hypothetical protein
MSHTPSLAVVPDTPVRPKAAARNPFVLVPIVLVLRELLERCGEITVRLSDLSDPGFMGLTEFATRTVDVEQTLGDAAFRWTLIHEFLHHLSGPTYEQFADIDEARIEACTAAVMLDAAAALALEVKAERLGKDVEKVDTPQARRRIVDGIEKLLAGAR